jgi:fumarate reductase flavoprotein subunit
MKIRTCIAALAAAAVLAGAFAACESAPREAAPIAGGASGTATGSAPGWGGEVTVTLTLVDGVITQAAVAGPNETPEFATRLLASAPGDMVRYNSPNIDVLAGSTVTSMAIRAAAQAAIDQIAAQAAAPEAAAPEAEEADAYYYE